MATLDTLSPQRRAVIELILRRGQSYDAVASMLNMPPARVRELAREALSALAPASSRRVDDEWRGQVADYVFGQQTGPESKATLGHLKRSEPARAWVSSLLDSLDDLYGESDRPEIPEAEASSTALAPRRREGGAGRAGAAAGAGAGAGAGLTRVMDRITGARQPSRASEADAGTAERERAPESDRAPEREREPKRTPGELSPAARAVVQRRRVIGVAAIGGIVVVVLVLLLLVRGGGDGENPEKAGPTPTPSQTAGGEQAQLVGQAQLQRQGGGDAEGVAVIARRGGEFQLLVQARGLEPSGRGAAYEVWLYNSQRDARSLGGQVTDNEGTLQGAGPLPANFRDYRFVDITREKIDDETAHSGDSVLRVPVTELLAGGAAAGGGGSGGGGATP